MIKLNRPPRRLIAIAALMAGTMAAAAPSRAGTDVTVDNSKAIAKALDVGVPFAANVKCTLLFTDTCSATYSVSASSRLVIEYVSFTCDSPTVAPQWGTFVIYTTTAGVAGYNAVSLPSNAGGKFVQLGQTVKLYVDAGARIVVTAVLATGTFGGNNPTCSVVFSGREIAL